MEGSEMAEVFDDAADGVVISYDLRLALASLSRS